MNKTKMIRTIKYKKWIIVNFILLIVSVLSILKFSKIYVLECLPDYLKNILISPEEDTNAYEVLSLANNFSLAYISSMIFYISIEYYPNKVKERKALRIVSNKLVSIYREMSYIIRVVLFEIKVNKDIKDLNTTDLSEVTTIFFESRTKYADIIYLRNNRKINVRGFEYNVFDDCKVRTERINKSIDEIFSMNIANNISDDLVELLSEIKQSGFASMLKYYDHEKIVKMPGIKQIIVGMDQYLFDLINYRKDLEKFDIELYDYRFEHLTEEEINKKLEERLYCLGRSIFTEFSYDKIISRLTYLPNIILDESNFNKLNGVLLEALVTYDIDKKKYKHMLLIAKDIAEKLKKYRGNEEFEDMAALNYLQVLRRMGTCTISCYDSAKHILENANKAKTYRLAAAIILEDYSKANEMFFELNDDQKKYMTCLPIYRLWDNPPLEANIQQPNFLINN